MAPKLYKVQCLRHQTSGNRIGQIWPYFFKNVECWISNVKREWLWKIWKKFFHQSSFQKEKSYFDAWTHFQKVRSLLDISCVMVFFFIQSRCALHTPNEHGTYFPISTLKQTCRSLASCNQTINQLHSNIYDEVMGQDSEGFFLGTF